MDDELVLALATAAIFFAPLYGPLREQQAIIAKQNEAMALFKERCKTAGENIHRVVDNVEGVVWMRWRDKEANYRDQFKLNDPFGHDCGAEDCIAQLLRATKGLENDPEKKRPDHAGYRYVETIDPGDGKRYRYSKSLIAQDPRLQSFPRPVIGREAIDQFTARYGITWDDLSTREERELWIAGGSLTVVDLKTNEVVAERVGFMLDRGGGAGTQRGFRSPWAFAADWACPQKVDGNGKRTQVGFTVRFANSVLRPSGER